MKVMARASRPGITRKMRMQHQTFPGVSPCPTKKSFSDILTEAVRGRINELVNLPR
jgi:hypothetical protein